MTDTTEKPYFEQTNAEYRETDEWGFVADCRYHLYNPNGRDVVLLVVQKAQPKYDKHAEPGKVYEKVTYYWDDEYTTPFYTTSRRMWSPQCDIDTDDALFAECQEGHGFDPVATLDSLAETGEIVADKLGMER